MGDAITDRLQRRDGSGTAEARFFAHVPVGRGEAVGFFRFSGYQVDRGFDSFAVWLPVSPGIHPSLWEWKEQRTRKRARCVLEEPGMAAAHNPSSLP